jgi:hypothetical protein
VEATAEQALAFPDAILLYRCQCGATAEKLMATIAATYRVSLIKEAPVM